MTPPPGFELGTDGPTVILVGVDLSESSVRAGAYAAGLARRQGSRLLAVHVTPVTTSGLTSMVPMPSPVEVSAQLGDEVRRLAEEGGRWAGVEVEVHTVVGDPFSQLARVADLERAELVVVGASQSAGHRYVGSVGARLMRTGRWPVLVVP